MTLFPEQDASWMVAHHCYVFGEVGCNCIHLSLYGTQGQTFLNVGVASGDDSGQKCLVWKHGDLRLEAQHPCEGHMCWYANFNSSSGNTQSWISLGLRYLIWNREKDEETELLLMWTSLHHWCKYWESK